MNTDLVTAGEARLGRCFYRLATLEMAPLLLGRPLVFDGPDGPVGGIIVEVEAYIGTDDAACHAAAGRTRRNQPMWGPPGRAYVYLSYGMHHCFNVVTEAEGVPAAILIRALEPSVGLETLAARRGKEPRVHRWLAGPGRIGQGLGLGLEQNDVDLVEGNLWIGLHRRPVPTVGRSSRIGIRRAVERPWRLFIPGHRSLSRALPVSSRRARRT